jgi:murein DD-endopeptidase MepM/ murein hydrolase activator NlpD
MKYKVKPGDTLSKIASQNGLTLQQLLDANPQFKANPNKLKVGDILDLPNGNSTAPTQPLPAIPTTPTTTATTSPGALGAAAGFVLGTLSAKFETGGKGPGTVSSGAGDPGGVSYGSYQMATKTGTVKRFVTQSDFPWRNEFQNLVPGTAGFTARWKEIAKNEPGKFQDEQHEFIKRTHFDLLVAKVQNEDHFDITKRSHAVQDAVWSTAVQHGGNTPIIHRALANVNASPTDANFDRLLISAIYTERGKRRGDGKLAYFPSSSPGVQQGVANRFKNEESDALKMLATEA